MNKLITSSSRLLPATALTLGIGAGAYFTPFATNSPEDAASCPAAVRSMDKIEIFFGLTRVHGGTVSKAEWSEFLDTEITPRFPEGLTAVHSSGQWLGNDGRITKENSIMVVVWHEPSRKASADADAIRAAYKERFDQESVMRVDSTSCVSF
jgi:hypothetical protein